MKLSVLLTVFFGLQVSATVFSQSKLLDLDLKNKTVREVLKTIESKTDFRFFYNDDFSSLNNTININVSQKGIEEILNQVLASKDVTYKVMADNLVVILPVAEAKQQKITGTVIDATNSEPIIGANVVVEGSTLGTTTDISGKFSINVSSSNVTLLISYIGYNSERVVLSGQSNVEVKLVPDITKLEEVVVIGYGTQKTRDVIGSVASVKSDQLSSLKSFSVNQALQGRASGVNVTTNSGMPGAPSKIRIRGTNSISSDVDPLWIIDGIPVYSSKGLERTSNSVEQDPLSTLNPNDIESIEILKDAAATSIYGSRGSNGVILVTTKTGKGTKGKGNVTVDYSSGISELSRTPEDIGFAGTKQWFQMADLTVQNQSNNPNAKFDPINSFGSNASRFGAITRAQAELNDNNWFNEALRKGNYQDVNLSATKILDNGSIFASVNYRKDKGVIKNNDLERISIRLNSDFQPVKNLSVGNKMAFAYTDNNRVKTGYSGSMGGGGGRVGAFEAANRNALPWMPIYDENDATGYWSPRAGNIAANNDSRFLRDYIKQYRLTGGLFAQYQLPWVKGLSIRSEVGLDFIQNASVEWKNSLITEDGDSYAYDQTSTRNVLNYNVYANYDHTFGDLHSVSMVLGTETMQMNQWTRYIEGQGLVGTYPEVGMNPAKKLNIGSRISDEDYLRSYFGRANYKLKDKYIAGVSFRRDGSSKFGSDFRWGTFTAFSAGWIVSEENFFKPLSGVVNMFKLRGSFGQTGNNSIPKGRDITTYDNKDSYRYGDAADINVGTRVTNIGNKALTWETTGNYDAGIDFGLFNNRLSGSFAYYYRDISDMLLNVDLPPSTGVGSNNIWSNVGDMVNKGIEFNISSVNIQTKDFSWTTDFNITTNANKIVSLNPILDKGGKGMDYGSGTRAVTGKRLGTYYMADYAGIDPEKGVEMIWEIDTKVYNETGQTIKTGRKIAATQANVGLHKFLFDDKTKLPTYYGGVSNSFSYKGFEMNVFFTFSGGNYIYDYNLKRASYFHNGQTILLADVTPENSWSATNKNAEYPKPSYNSSYPGANWDWTIPDPDGKLGYWDNNATKSGNYNLEGQHHSRFLYKGDYIRLKSLMLSYNLPAAWLAKAHLQGVRLYVQGTNLWTLTDYPGYDPEGRDWVDGTGIPNTKVYSVGASIKF